MGDNKRNSVGANRSGTSTPKLNAGSKGPSAAGPGELDFGKIIGARIKVTTSSPGPALEGTIYTACPITNILAISKTANPAKPSEPTSYYLLPVSRIKSFTITEASKTASPGTPPTASVFEKAQPPIARVDLKALIAREEAAVRRMHEKDALKGKGVSKEGQDVFDALFRTLPTRWHGTQIIVNDAVIVQAPYRVEDCQAPKDQVNNLNRVKRVLENERKKIAQRTSANSTRGSSPAPGQSPARPVGVGAGRGAGTAVATPVLPRKGG